LVRTVDENYGGNSKHPEVIAKYSPIELNFLTKVDQSLCPFSDDYFLSQIKLYEEISGRKLNQWEGELFPADNSDFITTPNPLGKHNVAYVSGQVRAVSSMLSIARLVDDAYVLDLGAGHGLSSEIFEFCGCRVHAIDIDPILSDLSIKRSTARKLRISRSVMNFEDIYTLPDHTYAAAFFYHSLHHCLQPWKLVQDLKSKLASDGVIGFTGEPIQNVWWKNWGIRLDIESLYVARKFGWFESGWSQQFIRDCFKKNGLTLHLLSGGDHGEGIGITSKSQDKLTAIINEATSLGFWEMSTTTCDNKYMSIIGDYTFLHGRPAFRTKSNHQGGFLCYGPYITLPPGDYSVSFILKGSKPKDMTLGSSYVIFDIVSNIGNIQHLKEIIHYQHDQRSHLIEVEFNISDMTSNVEARVLIVGSDIWTCSLPVFNMR
jgi:SAM-dependent methyltransferase